MNPLHYPSLELCKKLTSLGFPKTYMYYDGYGNIVDDNFLKDEYKFIVCPSVMELLDELPGFIETEDGICRLILRKERGWENGYYDKNNSAMIFNDNLPNSLAEMWLWIKEDDLLPKK